MKPWPIAALAAGLCLTMASSNAHAGAAEPGPAPSSSFVALFNGKDLSGWHGLKTMAPRKFEALSADAKAKALEDGAADVEKHWRVENGEIVNDGQGAYLTTDRDYGDVELMVDFKIGPKGDSGVYLRATPQVQIWDFVKGSHHNPDAERGSGGLWNNSPGAPGKDPLIVADRPIGRWNTFRILQVGERTTVHLNGKLVVDHARWENYWDRKLPLVKRGPIQLQTHNEPVHWRNIKVREIGAEEANAILAEHGREGFHSIFNGEDLTGWSGAVESYEVVGGELRCKPRKKGVVFHPDELTDFQARLEFKLPPGGNNGLAIRYPGSGSASSGAMCELQVLDDGHEKYARTLDPRQAHGSAYGMVGAHRGYLRPTGRWNFEEVTVKGSTIRVELNGTRILDADLSAVKEFMHGSPHPGKDRASGHFGFAGHYDPVAFRAISIKKLK